MSELAIGRHAATASRTVSIEDIEHFAHFTGDTFYAHMDEEAAKASPIFEGRVGARLSDPELRGRACSSIRIRPRASANTGPREFAVLSPAVSSDSMAGRALGPRQRRSRARTPASSDGPVEIFNPERSEMVADLTTCLTRGTCPTGLRNRPLPTVRCTPAIASRETVDEDQRCDDARGCDREFEPDRAGMPPIS
jgi:hypothetical protein